MRTTRLDRHRELEDALLAVANRAHAAWLAGKDTVAECLVAKVLQQVFGAPASAGFFVGDVDQLAPIEDRQLRRYS